MGNWFPHGFPHRQQGQMKRPEGEAEEMQSPAKAVSEQARQWLQEPLVGQGSIRVMQKRARQALPDQPLPDKHSAGKGALGGAQEFSAH